MSKEYIKTYSYYPGDEIADDLTGCLVQVEGKDFILTGILVDSYHDSIGIRSNAYSNGKGEVTRILKDDVTKFTYKEMCEVVIIPDVDEPITRDHILDTAKSIINGERQGTYGHAEDSFSTIAALWEAYLGVDVTSADVANMMILMKVARNSSGVYKEDNWVDICGYAALGGEIQGGQNGN